MINIIEIQKLDIKKNEALNLSLKEQLNILNSDFKKLMSEYANNYKFLNENNLDVNQRIVIIENFIFEQKLSFSYQFSILKEFWIQGHDDLVIEYARKYSLSNLAWENFYHGFWCIYMSSLLNKLYYEEFYSICNKYKFYLKDNDEFLKFLNISSYLGISKNSLNISYIRKYIEDNRPIYFNIIKNAKSIAIVGNSSDLIGKNMGKIINEFDIVIRFNNYKIEGFEDDYGSKTNIWIRGSGANNIIHKASDQFLMTVWEADYDHYELHYDHLDLMIDDYNKSHKFTTINPLSHLKLRDISKINYPSTGLKTIFDIFLIRNSFDNIKIFSFSTLNFEKSKVNMGHYFNANDSFELFPHNFYEENIFLLNFLKSNSYNFD